MSRGFCALGEEEPAGGEVMMIECKFLLGKSLKGGEGEMIEGGFLLGKSTLNVKSSPVGIGTGGEGEMTEGQFLLGKS